MWLLGALLQRGLGCEGGCPADLSSLGGRAALLLYVLGLPSLCCGFGAVRHFLLCFQSHLPDIQITVPYIWLMITGNKVPF